MWLCYKSHKDTKPHLVQMYLVTHTRSYPAVNSAFWCRFAVQYISRNMPTVYIYCAQILFSHWRIWLNGYHEFTKKWWYNHNQRKHNKTVCLFLWDILYITCTTPRIPQGNCTSYWSTQVSAVSLGIWLLPQSAPGNLPEILPVRMFWMKYNCVTGVNPCTLIKRLWISVVC